jgi:apolipoprotein N-acyltransferase
MFLISELQGCEMRLAAAVKGNVPRSLNAGDILLAMRSIPLRLWLLAALSGVLQALPFPLAGPAPAWRRAVCWVCLTPLLLALKALAERSPALKWYHAGLLGYLCGFVWYVSNCYWIEMTMHTYGGLPTAAAWGVLVLFALYLGLYHAAFAALLFLLERRLSWKPALLLSPVLWVAIELARTQITGFPWDLLGYTQVDHFLFNRLAPLAGVMSISLVVAAGNALCLLPSTFLRGVTTRRMAQAGVALLLTLAAASSPLFAPPPDPAPQRATLLQDNLRVGTGQDALEDSRETHGQMLDSFVALTLEQTQHSAPPDSVVLWPEAPSDLFDADPGFRSTAAALARAAHAPVIAEDVARAPSDPNGTRHLYNSARMTLADGSSGGRYDKIHLVPFGEYTPYKPLFFFAGHLLDDLPFSPGLERHPLVGDGHSYGVFICYESIFGSDVRQLTVQGAQVLVNLSDDGWYGDSSAPWEHLDMVRMRALENGRWLLRATNTGVTASIDPHGRIVSSLPRHQRLALDAPFAFRDGLTPYARRGDWIGWLCALAIIGVFGWGAIARRPVH